MSLSTGTVTVTDSWFDGQRQQIRGRIAFGASPLTYAAGGLVTSLAIAGIQTSLPPDAAAVQVWGIAGFIYVYIPGTTLANGKVEVWCEGAVSTDAPLVEHSTAALVAGVSGDTVRFSASVKTR